MYKTLNNWYSFLVLFLIFEGLFPIFSYFALQNIPTLWLVAFSILISFLFWLIVFIVKRLHLEYLKKELLLPTFLSALFLWTWWMLYFFWVKYSSPSIASIMLLLQTLFAFIIFNLLWKDNYNYKQVIWAVLMAIWWFLVLYEWDSFINVWALIMVIAWIVFTIWNFYTKKASLIWANPFFLLINRNFLMLIITSILGFLFVWEPDFQIIQENFIWIFLIWFLVLFLSKAFWIIALSKLNSFVAISSMPIIPLFVLIFSFFILNDIPNTQKLLWFLPIMVWWVLITRK